MMAVQLQFQWAEAPPMQSYRGWLGLQRRDGMRHWGQLTSDTGPDSGQMASDVRCLNGIHVRDGSPLSSASC